MKTMETYKKPECEVFKLCTEDLCINFFGSEAPDDPDNPNSPLVGAKRGQNIYDDDAEEGYESDL